MFTHGMIIPDSLPGLRRELNDAFDKLVNGNGSTSGVATWSAPMSLWEQDGRIHIEMDAPGLTHDMLDVTFEDGRLTIKGERPAPDKDGRKYWHSELRFGEFQRIVTLPETVDASSIDAELCDGVLHVTFCKKPEAQPTKIEVKATKKLD